MSTTTLTAQQAACEHDDTSSDSGRWTCDHCGADTTATSFVSLLDDSIRLLQAAKDNIESRPEAGYITRGDTHLVVEALLWTGVLEEATKVLLRDQGPNPFTGSRVDLVRGTTN